MYKPTLALLVLTLATSSAKADFWSDMKESVEKGVSKLGQAAGDVVTLGEEGRRRDREAAEQAKRRAEDAQRAAEQLRDQKIHSLQNDIAQLGELKIILSSYGNTLVALQTRFDTSLKLSATLKTALELRNLDSNAIQNIIELQRSDLNLWVAALDQQLQDPANQQNPNLLAMTAALKSKVTQYFDQIVNLPQGSAQDVDGTIDSILDLGFESLEMTKALVNSIAERIAAAQAEIQTKETEIKTLQGQG